MGMSAYEYVLTTLIAGAAFVFTAVIYGIPIYLLVSFLLRRRSRASRRRRGGGVDLSRTVCNQAKEAAGGEAEIGAVIRVEQVYGPMREVMADDGQILIARDVTETDYDEVDAGLRPGRPTEIPDGGFNMVVRERTSTTTDVAPDPSPTRIDTGLATPTIPNFEIKEILPKG